MSVLADANGQRFWLLADEAFDPGDGRPAAYRSHFATRSAERVEYDSARRSLRLESRRALEFEEVEASARAALELPPHMLDLAGARAYWTKASDGSKAVLFADGAAPDLPPVAVLATQSLPDDSTAGHDGLLYLALGGTLRVGRLADLEAIEASADAWPAQDVAREDFNADRLAARPGGGVHVLELPSGRLARLDPDPEALAPIASSPRPGFAPCAGGPPLALRLEPLARLPDGESAIDLDAHPETGTATLLSWGSEDRAYVRRLGANGRWGAGVALAGIRFPHSLRWIDAQRVAVLLAGLPEAIVFDMTTEGGEAQPAGDRYPLVAHGDRDSEEEWRFARALDLPPAYGRRGSATRRLRALSLPSFALEGSIRAHDPRPPELPIDLETYVAGGGEGRSVDSGDARTVWHRAVVEAVVPPGCGLRLHLAAGDSPTPRENGGTEWFPHDVGDTPRYSQEPVDVPRAAWMRTPCELPFHPGLLPCAPEPGRAGSFQVLIQRAYKRVRALEGRFLHVRVQLFGTGLRSPELFGVRFWASRFSYAREYLPELFRERVFGEPAEEGTAEQPVPSTRHDFLERFLAGFESVLTPLEDRVAAAHALTDAWRAPEGALDWLGSWVGLAFDARWDADTRRRLLARSQELFRWRGTRRGVEGVIESLVPELVRSGAVLLLEGWQLRRTFATILGADLADEDDPLTGALAVSGNSYVGDTLVLGDEENREFLALFSAELDLDAAERAAVSQFFERLAHRLLIVFNDDLDEDVRALVRRAVLLSAPAHIEVQEAEVSQRLRIGLASLVGVDTRPSVRPAPRRVRVGASALGHGDRVGRPPSLDPRITGDLR